jgi:transposase
MAFLFKKKVRGIYSLYMGENKKIRGVSTRVKSKYLGPLQRFTEYFTDELCKIEHIKHYEYGLSCTLKQIMDQFIFQKIFRNKIQKQVEDPYIDKLVVLMVMNRLADPCAKYSMQRWFKSTDLVNTFDMPIEELEAHKVYRAMDQLDKYAETIEKEICKTILIQENISLDMIYLDFTNQETYSRNHDSELLKNGHNKRGHDDLLQVNLSLTCDSNTGIPFFHKNYPGNYNDKQFIKLYTEKLRTGLDELGYTGKNTLIIDRGINGYDDFKLLRDHRFDYIGGLIQKDFPKYFCIPKSKLRNTHIHKRETKEDVIIKYASVKEEIYGQEHLIITLYNVESYKDKIEALDNNLKDYKEACEKQLQEFKKEIEEKTFQSYWNNVDKIKNKLKEINKECYPLLRFEIKSYRFNLTWNISQNNKEYNKNIDNFGKYVLFTSRLELKPKEIIELFYDKKKIEKNFHYLKSNGYTNRYLRMGPMLHSKDERIRSHNYTCVLALQIYQIINHRLKKKGLDMSVQDVLDELKTITYYHIKVPGQDEPIKHVNLITDKQKEILRVLEVKL